MTPRIVVSALKKDMAVQNALTAPGKMPFSRMPIYVKDLDSIAGFVLREDLPVAQNQGRGAEPIAQFRREILSVPSTTPLSRLLETLLETATAAQRQTPVFRLAANNRQNRVTGARASDVLSVMVDDRPKILRSSRLLLLARGVRQALSGAGSSSPK